MADLPGGLGYWGVGPMEKDDPNRPVIPAARAIGAENQSSTSRIQGTTDPGTWGHQGNDVYTDPDGETHAIIGSNGMNRDVDRYRGMASTPVNAQGPQIQNGARGLGMGALDILRARAEGAETPADVQAREQTAGAVNGIQSGAASIKGGAGARAAAARGAVATGANVQAQGDQDAAALHARGMASAGNQFFGAASGQRATDLNVATANAKYQAGQNALNDNREGFYENIAQDTQGAQQNHLLGRNEAESNAAGAAFNTGMARDAADRNATRNAIGTAGSIGSGTISGVQTYANGGGGGGQQNGGQGDPNDPWSKANYSGSSEEMKTDIRPLFGKEDTDLALTPPPKAKKPVSDKEAKRLADYAKGMVPNARAAAGMSTVDTPGNLSAQRGEVEAAKPRAGGIIRDNPYGEDKPKNVADSLYAAGPHIEQQRYGLFEPEEGGARARLGGNHGYAASRAGHAGAMFGKPVGPAIHGYEPAHEGARGERDRDVAMSDPRAKQEAFDLGITAGRAQATAPQGEVSGVRMMMGERPRSEPAPEASEPDGHARKLADAEPKGHGVRQPVAFNRDVKRAVFDKAGNDISGREPSAEQPMAPVQPPPSPQENGSYFGQLAARARAMTPSDPRAKEDVHGSPMASANRSMEPFSYEYKAEFTPPEQRPHEKNVGPMANKMEANPVAATAIVKDPGTGLLAIDKTKGLKLVMGGLSSLQRQVDELESRRAVNK